MPILSPHLFYQGLVHNGLIAWFDPGWQILTGQTSQTLIDRTGKGNNGQLGSTAGVDINDPAFSNGGITFGSDDYVICTQSSFDSLPQLSVITVYRSNSAGGGAVGRFWDKNNATRAQWLANTSLVFFQLYATNNKQYTSNFTLPHGSNYVVGVIYTSGNTPTMWKNNSKAASLSVSGTGSGGVLSDSAGDLYIGNRPTADRNFDGTIFVQLWYNRILSDAEYLHNYYVLRRIMAGRGITI